MRPGQVNGPTELQGKVRTMMLNTIIKVVLVVRSSCKKDIQSEAEEGVGRVLGKWWLRGLVLLSLWGSGLQLGLG